MTNFSEHEKSFDNNPTRFIRRGIFWLLGLCLLVGGSMWIFDLVTTPARTAKDIIQKTLNADNVLANYEWFKQQYNDYLAINKKIAESDSSVSKFERNAGARTNWTFEDKNEHSRLSSISDGLKYQKADIVAKYNARSKMLNRELFKTSDLPAEL